MCNRLCLFAAAAALLIVAAKVGDVTPPVYRGVHLASHHVESRVAPDEVVVDKKFKVSSGDNLLIDVAHSDVSIRTGSSTEAAVRIVVEGERARRFFEHLNFSVEKIGRTLSITTDPRGNWNRGGGDIEVYVTVPEHFDADIDVGHGDVSVERLDGALEFRVAHGDFSAESLTGSLLKIELAHGDFDADRLMSEKIKISAAHSDVSVASLTAAEFDVDLQHGDIEIDRAEGRARVTGAHSDIEIAFAKLNGGEFTNSHGDIDIAAPAGAPADLDFQADEIDISSGHGFVGTLRDKRAEGRVSGGGPKMVARTSHGGISLREM